MTARIRVAEAGIRGVPAAYGGSETAVEEIGRRLASDGVHVVVYCRRHKSPFPDREYLGMERVVLPSIPTFRLDTVSHSLLATIHLLVRDTADVIHFHGMGNALCLPLLRWSRKASVVTIDGPDWERPKWGPIAKRVLRFSARLATRLADHVIIDNKPSVEYFRRLGLPDERFTYIPYGANLERPAATNHLEELGLEPRSYVLYVGALVPDKGADLLLDAYRSVRSDTPLVVIGDTPFESEFRAHVHRAAAEDPRVRMLGYRYGDAYDQLVANAYAYVHPARNEGTSPALLQAMGFGNCIVASGIDEARHVVADAGIIFEPDDAADLARQLERVLGDPDLAAEHRHRALERVRTEYSWEDVAAKHREVYERVAAFRLGCTP